MCGGGKYAFYSLLFIAVSAVVGVHHAPRVSVVYTIYNPPPPSPSPLSFYRTDTGWDSNESHSGWPGIHT